MNDESPPPVTAAATALRQRAEALFLERAPQTLGTLSPEKAQQLLHELQVHQIELEMQNEEMQRLHLEMEASRARYFDLYDLAPVGYLTVSEAGMILVANVTAAKMLGVSPSALVTQPFTRFIVREDQDVFYLQRNQLQEMAVPQDFELRLSGRGPQPFWAHLAISLATDADGAAETRIVLTDISARRRTEEEILLLNTSLEQRVQQRTAELLAANASLTDFKAALDEHSIVAITDVDGVITYANDKFCEISKYPREELLGQNHRIFNSDCHPAAFFDELWQTILSGRVWKGEVKNYAKDGTVYWVSSTIVPFHGPDGKPTQFIAIRTDITTRKLAEEVVILSEERLGLAAEMAGLAVWEWDLTSNEIKWDEQMFRIYGLPPFPQGRARYSDWQAAVLPADLAEQEAQLQHTIATCGRSQREFRITRASDHAVRVIQAAEMVVTADDGRAARMVGINLDITERRQTEAEISKLNADLQCRAAELEASNKELEAFSYSVSHDLRAPLRAVDGFSRMLIEDYSPQLGAGGQRMLGVIHEETQRMGRLIDDLLAFCRLGRQQMEPLPVNMYELAQEVYDEIAGHEPARRLRLDLHPLPPACGSVALIRQVWVNLIANAIKFTKERECGEIEIGAQDGEDSQPVYYVKDNGAGFDMRYADKLFGVFQRLHKPHEFAGTGVGLALVQRIVQRHGGQVWAEAEVDHGATFYFTLPNQNP